MSTDRLSMPTLTAHFLPAGEAADPAVLRAPRAAYELSDRAGLTVPAIRRLPVAQALAAASCERLVLCEGPGWIEQLPVSYNVVSGRDFWSDAVYLFLDGPDCRRIRLLHYRLLTTPSAPTAVAGDVLVPWPSEADTTAWRESTVGLAGAGQQRPVSDLGDLLEALRQAGRTPVRGDEAAIEATGAAEAGELVLGESRYALVVLPAARTWRYKTLVCLEHYVAQGGRLVVCGEPPTEVDCEDYSERWQTVISRATTYADFIAAR